MSDGKLINRASLKHAYEQVADTVAGWIADGTFTIRLPSEHNLAHKFDVSGHTVRHAMAILRERGLIVSIHGRGTFVAAYLRTGEHRQP